MIIKEAVLEEELKDVYRLRYNVYCLERGYENPKDYPDQIETDKYDPYSVHLIAYVKSKPVGTVRLILPNPFGFPVERHCNVDVRAVHGGHRNVAEISRLAVSSSVAKGWTISRTIITLALIKELFRTMRKLKIRYVYTAMNQGLERLLKRCGMHFIKAGQPVEYHGLRVPFYAEVEPMVKEVARKRADIFQFFLLPRNAFYSMR